MPFRDHVTGERYTSFEDCKKKNRDKRSPGGYCATSKRISEEEPNLIEEIETKGKRRDEKDLMNFDYDGFDI